MPRAAGALALAVAALVASGCGTVGVSRAGQGDTGRGKQLFVAKCGSCHVLADAGTQGTIGPNLDAAFAQARRDGLGETTIQSVVRGQIAYPVEQPPTGQTGMPANLVTGDDADAVAAYVATAAGRPGAGGAGGAAGGGAGGGADQTTTEGTTTREAGGGGADGKAVFASAGCGSCHTLAAAGASGTVGPNLDEARPSAATVEQRVREGKGVMPSFAGRLSDAEIAAVAEYVSKSARG